MHAASLVASCEGDVKNMLGTFRNLNKGNVIEGFSDDEGEKGEKSTLATVAEMMNNLKNRKEYKLGKYYQMVKQHEVTEEDLEQMVRNMKMEAISLRKALRVEVSKAIEKFKLYADGKFNVKLFSEVMRTIEMPEPMNP